MIIHDPFNYVPVCTVHLSPASATSAILWRDRGWRRKGRARGVAKLGHARSGNNAVRWNWSLGHTSDSRLPAPDVGCVVGSVGERETGREGEGKSHVVDKNIAATAEAADAALVGSAPRQGHEVCVFFGVHGEARCKG